jgi:hypothetical protein
MLNIEIAYKGLTFKLNLNISNLVGLIVLVSDTLQNFF